MSRQSSLTVLTLATILSLNCGGGGSSSPSPTAPTTTAAATPTRTINLTGNLSFGQVTLGSSRSATFTIGNSGNSTLTVSGLTATSGFVGQSFTNWTSGQIPAGGSQTVTVTFSPTTAGTYNGTLTVNADHTSGTNTISFTAVALDNSFAGNWSGNYIVERCDGSGSMQDILCSAPSGSRPGGIFPIGTSLPVTISLNQNGTSVSGTWALGQVIGTATGVVTNGVLTLQGTARSNTLTAVISQWSTQVSGSVMTGTASYNITISGAPGTGVMVTRFSNLRK